MSTAAAVELPSAEELARLAHLRHVADEEAGFARAVNGHGFKYLNIRGNRLRNPQHLAHIEALAIPPAWTEVWICRYASGHLQATGHDARGRKQYLYHERWRAISNSAKFWRLKVCPQLLPKLRRSVTRDLRGKDLSATRVLAGMVALLDLTSIRIGNEEYVRANGSYGLATLRNRHVQLHGNLAHLSFRGKSGIRREVEVADRRLVRLLRQLKRLPGTHVFQYRDAEDRIVAADSVAVNTYLLERTGHHFTAKDFRTWKASSLAAGMLFDARNEEKLATRKRILNKTVATVAEALGNTKTVCRKYYIHSELLDCYLDGRLSQMFRRLHPRRGGGLLREEQILASFLRRS